MLSGNEAAGLHILTATSNEGRWAEWSRSKGVEAGQVASGGAAVQGSKPAGHRWEPGRTSKVSAPGCIQHATSAAQHGAAPTCRCQSEPSSPLLSLRMMTCSRSPMSTALILNMSFMLRSKLLALRCARVHACVWACGRMCMWASK